MLRIDHGYSMRQLGEALGCSHNAVWSYESGRTQPSYENARRLVELFGVSVETLLAPYNGTLPPVEPNAEATLTLPPQPEALEGLRRWRREFGIGQVELAQRLGVAQATVSSWETGLRSPGREHVSRLRELSAIR